MFRDHLYSQCPCSIWYTVGGDGAQSLSHVQLFATPWTVACQAPLSMGFSRQEYWVGRRALLPSHTLEPYDDYYFLTE